MAARTSPSDPSVSSPPPALAAGELRIIEPLCAIFRRHLRTVKLKYTPERARVLEAVLAMTGPFLADDLLARLGPTASVGERAQPAVSKATCYRTLRLLEDAGIVRKLLLVSEQAHYQLAYAQPASALLVRIDTLAVTTLDAPGLDALARELATRAGLRLEGVRLVLYAAKP